MLRNALLALCATVISLFAAEIAMRVAAPELMSVVPDLENGEVTYRPHQTCRFRSVEWDYLIRINGLGFREDLELDAITGAFSVVLGDSFTEGYGVDLERSFPKVLESLARERGRSFTVFNAGHYATGPFNAMRVYRDFFAERPGLERVFLGFFVGNDLLSPTEPRDGLLPPGPTYAGGPIVRIKTLLGEHSILYSALNRAVKGSPRLLALCRRAGFCGSFRPIDIYNPERVADRVVFTIEQIEAFARRVQRDGHDFTAVLVPTREQVEEIRWQRLLATRRTGEPPERFGVNRALARGLEKAGVSVIDLAPAMLAHERTDGQPLYFTHDPHWNERGHTVAAAAILEFLERNEPGDGGASSSTH